MARDRTARNRIRTYLATHGPVEDRSGYATAVLKEAIGYEGSSVAFIQLIAAMDRDEEIVRDIRGKRTYLIAPGANALPAPPSAPDASAHNVSSTVVVQTEDGNVHLDYDRLSRALVRALLEVSVEATSESPLDPRHDYIRQLEQARAQIDELLGRSTVHQPESARL